MRRTEAAAALLITTLVVAGCAGAPGRGRPPAHLGGGMERGLVFGLFARAEPAFARRNLAEIRALGADAISIVVPWVTPDVRSTSIAPRGDMTPTDRALRRAIREAHRLGLSVLLMPLVYVDEMREGEWRGTIEPPDWEAWFAAYERFALHYARLAASEEVTYFSIGSELCSTESRREDWLRIVARVREVYGGALTYSANWDHLDPISFVDALDLAGTNAYFEVGASEDPTVEEMADAWRPVVERVEAWRARWGKPLLLTEVGYPSRRGAASDPWNHASDGAPDPALQERCYRAFVRAWTGQPGLAGVYFYIWWGNGGPDDAGYTPRGKPASEVIRAWFGSRREGDPR